jgi:hypothetical protein
VKEWEGRVVCVKEAWKDILEWSRWDAPTRDMEDGSYDEGCDDDGVRKE